MSAPLSVHRASTLGMGLTLSALTVCIAMATPTSAQSSATVRAKFAPNRLAAKGALTLTMHFASALGVPSPLRGVVMQLPAGVGMSIPVLRSCGAGRLRALGAGGCPAQSRIGDGHAIVEARAGSQLISESIDLLIFLGPPRENLQPTFEVLGQGRTPLLKRLVLSGTVIPGRPPYGEAIAMNIPPIATLPLERDASIAALSLTVGTTVPRRAANANTVEVPADCPAGGFPFAGEFTFADGSASSSPTTVGCPQDRRRHARSSARTANRSFPKP